MKKLVIYFLNQMGICVGDIKDISPHSHHFIQISIGHQKGFNVLFKEKKIHTHAMIISNDVEHQFTGLDARQVIILIDPESIIGQELKSKVLGKKMFLNLDVNLRLLFRSVNAEEPLQVNELQDILGKLFDHLIGYDQSQNKSENHIDPRVANIQCLIKNEGIELNSTALAKAVFLSESRLMHLFKEEVGISIKYFILWQKLLRAIHLMLNGKSFTVAAVDAGFSDSAHLSRTFRRMFGVTPSEVFKNSSSVQVIMENYD